MPISQSDQLFTLIKTLTKAEKRNFKLYAKRNQNTTSLKFIKLFELLDKQKVLDEKKLVKSLQLKSKNQYPNLKRHLYQQILLSIKIISSSKDIEFEVRELLDFSDILYGKGLYNEALKILNKAEQKANEAGLQLLAMTAIEKKKTIVSRHITRSKYSEINNLIIDTNEMMSQINPLSALSNLNVELHAKYIRNGHVNNQAEKENIISFLEMHKPKVNADNLDFNGRMYLYTSLVWYYYILMNFESCYSSAESWIACFEENPLEKRKDPDLYMRGYHYLLIASYNLYNKEAFKKHLAKLEKFRKENYTWFNFNSKILSFIYVHTARINMHILNGSYTAATQDIKTTLSRLKRYQNHMDEHKILIFNFKIAWLFLASGNAKKSISYLHDIINRKERNLREDIQLYTRLMFLMAHFELKNYDLLEYLSKNYRRYFNKAKDLNSMQKASLKFFESACKLDEQKQQLLLEAFITEIKLLKKNPFNIRAFLYLDIEIWAQAKLKGISIEKFRKTNPDYLRIK